MIVTDAEIADGQAFEAEFCVVGSGPAGITIALQLAGQGRKVVLITGGGWTESPENQDLYRGESVPEGSHEPLEETRRRQFGGTSSAWGGRCIPFEPIDFEERSWVPDSGWPFPSSELDPYFRQAAAWCQIGNYLFDAREQFPGAGSEIIAGFDNEVFVSHPLERWSPPVDFAKEYRGRLEAAPDLQVLLDCHLLAFRMEDGAEKVTRADVACGPKRFRVKAGNFVLAAGGIENARLLLASANDHFPSGLGNQNDNVGRYYMGHLIGTFAEVIPAEPEKVILDFERDPEGVYCRRRWWITGEAQRERELLNTIFFLYHTVNQEGHRDALFSATFVAKALLSVIREKTPGRMLRRVKVVLPGMREHLSNLARRGPAQAPAILRTLLRRMERRRLPFVLPDKRSKSWGLYFQAEQTPCRDSRITLSETEKDAFGMPRAVVSMAFNDIDPESVVKAHELFAARFHEKNLGKVKFDLEDLRDFTRAILRRFNSAAHHLGATRMSDDPATGVVDRNAKVHGLANLYIAGSSVFPTGGHANPTLTLLALALRLADHLQGVR